MQENEEGSVHDIPKSSLYTSTRAASSVSKIQVMYQVTGFQIVKTCFLVWPQRALGCFLAVH